MSRKLLIDGLSVVRVHEVTEWPAVPKQSGAGAARLDRGLEHAEPEVRMISGDGMLALDTVLGVYQPALMASFSCYAEVNTADREVFFLGDSPSAAEWALAYLQANQLDQFARQTLCRSGISDRKVSSLHRKVTGQPADEEEWMFTIPADVCCRILRLAARMLASDSTAAHTLLLRWLTDADDGARVPFRALSSLHDGLDWLTRVEDPEAGELYVPLAEDGARNPFELDLVAPDLSLRVWVRRRPRGFWEMMLQRNPSRQLDMLQTQTPDRASAWRFENPEPVRALLDALAKSAGTDRLELASGHQLYTRSFGPASELEDVDRPLRWFTASDRSRAGALTPVPLASREQLHERAQQLGVRGRTTLEDGELRHAIAAASVKRAPAETVLAAVGPGCFVRKASWRANRPQPHTVDQTALESLVCHALGGRFVQTALTAQPQRLGDSLAAVEAYVPLNPFAGMPPACPLP